MRCSLNGAPGWVQLSAQVQGSQVQAQVRATRRPCLHLAHFVLFAAFPLLSAVPSFCQDNGSVEREFHGSGVELTVTVHDRSGEVMATPALVKVYRDGSIPSGQGQTSRGQAIFVVNSTGEFTIVVMAAGYAEAQQNVSVPFAGRAQIDVYLRRASAAETAAPPGRPVLAPKAREALDKALQALGADKLEDAEKYLRKAAQLAPSHPDVLYLQGFLLMQRHDWVQAQLSFEKATQLDPAHAPALAALGMALYDQGHYPAAIAPLEKSLQLETAVQPNAAGAWQTRWTLAKAYYHSEKYDQALQMSQEALAASHGKAPEIALLVAQSLTAVGRYEDAAQTLHEFLRDHPQQPEAATAQRWLDRLAASGKLPTAQKP